MARAHARSGSDASSVLTKSSRRTPRAVWALAIFRLAFRLPSHRRSVTSIFAASVAILMASAARASIRLRKYQERLVAASERALLRATNTHSTTAFVSEPELKRNAELHVPSGDPSEQLALFASFGDDALVFAASARAVLLQMGHPYVAQGVFEHSYITQDPAAASALRFYRTFGIMFPIWFGSDERRAIYCQKWRAMHRRVKGTLAESAGRFQKGDVYSAGDLQALWWVQATLTESIVAYWSVMCPEKATEDYVDAFWSVQGRRNFLVVGIPPEMVPLTYREFEEKYTRIWEDLGVTTHGRSVVAGLQSAGQGRGPVVRYVAWSIFDKSIEWLPPHFAQQFGVRSQVRKALAHASLCLDLGLLSIFRGTLMAVGAGRFLEQSYIVEMRKRAGEKPSTFIGMMNAVGRDAGLMMLRFTLGPAVGLNEDWS